MDRDRAAHRATALRNPKILALLLAVLVAAWIGSWLFGLVALPIGLALAVVMWLRPARTAATMIGILGGMVGVYNAGSALAVVGGVSPYVGRQGFGWAALLLAALGAVAAAKVSARPRLAGVTMLLSGFGGFLAINLFYIDTWYVIAWVLLSIGGMWALLAPGRPATTGET